MGMEHGSSMGMEPMGREGNEGAEHICQSDGNSTTEYGKPKQNPTAVKS